MERVSCNTLQNLDDSQSDILKKQLLQPASTTLITTSNSLQQNVLMNTIRVSYLILFKYIKKLKNI